MVISEENSLLCSLSIVNCKSSSVLINDHLRLTLDSVEVTRGPGGIGSVGGHDPYDSDSPLKLSANDDEVK